MSQSIFAQFAIYKSKDKLNYLELKDILTLSVTVKKTWNYDSFKKASHAAWISYKDKLTYRQKIIFREAIKSLRKFIYEKKSEGLDWVTSDLLLSYFNSSVVKLITDYNSRQKILRAYSHEFLFI